MRPDRGLQSVVPVRSAEGGTAFGSSFAVRHDAGSSYLVTCAHVVRDVGGEGSVRIHKQPAKVVACGSPDGGDDLAVLVTDRLQIPPVRLAYDAEPGRAVSITGVRPISSQPGLFLVEPLDAKLGSRSMLDSPTGRVEAWRLRMSESGLSAGYSGSPVIDLVTGEAVGVAAYREGDRHGIAIATNVLRRLWPDGIATLDTPRSTFAGTEFCYVPAGPFGMGTAERRARELAERMLQDGFRAEVPDHTVDLDGFYIARLPVTNRQYAKFVDATGRAVPWRDDWYSQEYSWDPVQRTYPAANDHLPVVLVSWHDVHDYCCWAGARLPTEAEWEKAARGADRRTWPWGDTWDERRCNTIEGGRRVCLPVGELSPAGDSPYGVADLSGNVWEWCSSIFDAYPYRADSREDPNALGDRVLRGGAWGNDRWWARCAARGHAPPSDFGFTIGFRLALAKDPGLAADRDVG